MKREEVVGLVIVGVVTSIFLGLYIRNSIRVREAIARNALRPQRDNVVVDEELHRQVLEACVRAPDHRHNLLNNVTSGKFSFGEFDDEVWTFELEDGTPVVVFQGTDMPDASYRSSITEWRSNMCLVFAVVDPHCARLSSFREQLEESLPATHKTPDVIYVSHSRGGWLMSSFVHNMPRAARGIAFIASPGQYHDVRSKGTVYNFDHRADPVTKVSMVTSTYDYIFSSLKRMTPVEIHGTWYVPWIQELLGAHQ